jgi:hypothetical protein
MLGATQPPLQPTRRNRRDFAMQKRYNDFPTYHCHPAGG